MISNSESHNWRSLITKHIYYYSTTTNPTGTYPFFSLHFLWYILFFLNLQCRFPLCLHNPCQLFNSLCNPGYSTPFDTTHSPAMWITPNSITTVQPVNLELPRLCVAQTLIYKLSTTLMLTMHLNSFQTPFSCPWANGLAN